MQTWKKQFERAKTVEGKRSVVERHIKALAEWEGRLPDYQLATLSDDRRAEMESLYATYDARDRDEEDQQRAAQNAEKKAAPFGRCIFSGVPLPDPGSLTYEQAESRFGFAPCQVRYGTWPNGMRVE
jgi:hypothetical protein